MEGRSERHESRFMQRGSLITEGGFPESVSPTSLAQGFSKLAVAAGDEDRLNDG